MQKIKRMFGLCTAAIFVAGAMLLGLPLKAVSDHHGGTDKEQAEEIKDEKEKKIRKDKKEYGEKKDKKAYKDRKAYKEKKERKEKADEE